MFNLVRVHNGQTNVIEPELFEATANVDIEEGMALYLASGKLAKATIGQKPEFIGAKNATYVSGAKVPVYRIETEQVYECPVKFSSTPKTLVVGTKLLINDAADTAGLVGISLGVTDETTRTVSSATVNGVAEIVDTLGATATGDKVLVMFR